MDALQRLIASLSVWFTTNLIALKPDLIVSVKAFIAPDFMQMIQEVSIIIGCAAGVVAFGSALQLIKKRNLEIKHLELENRKLEKEAKNE